MPEANTSQLDQTHWHTLPADTVLGRVHSSSSRLSQQQAQARLAAYGPNRLPEAAKRTAFTIIVALLLGMTLPVTPVNTLVVMEIFHLFFIRNIDGTSLTWKAVHGARVVWAVVVTATVAQSAITVPRSFARQARLRELTGRCREASLRAGHGRRPGGCAGVRGHSPPTARGAYAA